VNEAVFVQGRGLIAYHWSNDPPTKVPTTPRGKPGLVGNSGEAVLTLSHFPTSRIRAQRNKLISDIR
jgi:hypothetical protein